MSKKYPVNKPIQVASLGYIVLFLLVAISRNFVSSGDGGWSNLSTMDFIFGLGISICFSILGAGYTYYSWTYNANDFLEWSVEQSIWGEKWARNWWGTFPEYRLWSARIGGPFMSVIGFGFVGFMLLGMVTQIVRAFGF